MYFRILFIISLLIIAMDYSSKGRDNEQGEEEEEEVAFMTTFFK
jgi:hypothetical protein